MVLGSSPVAVTIFHARKSLLFDKTSIWVKNDKPDFDVTIGSYDGAEVCQLVGLYLLNLLTNEFGKHSILLYKDDGLSCFQNISGPESEKTKRKICKIIKENSLNITVECYLTITDFLDVIFDLKSGTYYPYRKQNNAILYIHKQSNHPPSIIKQIPSMKSKRVSDISCDSDHFHKVFNPPYSANVKTKVGKLLMRLTDKHFPSHHKSHKLLNHNNVKLSYSCLPSMKNVIQKHNSKIMENPKPTNNKTCSCREKSLNQVEILL